MRNTMVISTMILATLLLFSCKEKNSENNVPWLVNEANEESYLSPEVESETSGTSAMEAKEAEAEKAAAKRAEGNAGLKNTYYSHRFSIGYPEALKERFTDETTFTAETIDKDSRMNVVYEQDGSFADLIQCAEKFKQEGDEDEVFEATEINGDVMTMKSTNLGETCIYFVVRKDAVTGVVGKYYFRSSRAADFEKYYPSIIKSIDIK